MQPTAPRKLQPREPRPLPNLAQRRRIVNGIPPDLLHRRRAARRALVDARQCRQAIEHIITLPDPSESLHFLVDGRFEPCDLIPATRRLSAPAIIKQLTLTTLGLNSDNVSCIANGMDQGKILDCTILVSTYFSRMDKPVFEFVQKAITARGGQVHAAKTHAKIILLEMTDGNHYTIEGSGNLRSCDSIEQFVMTNDAELLNFHRQWITAYINSKGPRNEKGERGA